MYEKRASYLIKTVKNIGEGAFGIVDKIELYNIDMHKCGNYAKKTFKEQHASEEVIKLLGDFKRRFSREVEYQSSCSHSNIAYICMHNLLIDNPWFIMELAETDLYKELLSGKMDNKEKLKAIFMVFDGVQYLHERNLLHRDLKPQNILKFSNGVYKISDFGFVKNTDENSESEVLTKIAMNAGTEGYKAPEIGWGAPYSKESDIFALGKILQDLKLNVNGVERIIEKSMKYRPEQRYHSVIDMKNDIMEASKNA